VVAIVAAWWLTPWYAAIIAAGIAILVAPLMLQYFSDEFVDGRHALLWFSAGSLLPAIALGWALTNWTPDEALKAGWLLSLVRTSLSCRLSISGKNTGTLKLQSGPARPLQLILAGRIWTSDIFTFSKTGALLSGEQGIPPALTGNFAAARWGHLFVFGTSILLRNAARDIHRLPDLASTKLRTQLSGT
jgi:hypothetical protein